MCMYVCCRYHEHMCELDAVDRLRQNLQRLENEQKQGRDICIIIIIVKNLCIYVYIYIIRIIRITKSINIE